MCRLYALLANEPTKVECSLVHAQNALMERNKEDSTGKSHVDGWGLVCYDENDRNRIPTIVKHHNAAYDRPQFSRSAAKAYSKSVVAHVRSATVGYASMLNAHPFTHNEWTFAHHGTIPSFKKVSKMLEANTDEPHMNCRLGNTDSELFFLWLLSQWEVNGVTSEDIAKQEEEARRILSHAIVALADECLEEAPDEVAKLNFVLTNGHILFACRWNNAMHWVARDGVYDCEICGTPHIHHDPDVEHRAIVVASQPITRESWQEIPNYSLMYVSPDLTCVVHPIPNNNLEEAQ